ncbi:MAG: radical SAM protein [Kiritimatiellae bacterium]|nr:radical SAM protein [Kiritimatiellia bacterium]MDD3545829.1 radical SAM protein [Kiritimatiellia bacterium]MDD4025039.1 radical SAM protein [Kiritimatiellia bacterium]MDD4623001.1 radical SAM protein [Kiritimatiellia bacterium]
MNTHPETRPASPLSSCRLCPRACGADRLAGRLGYCKAGVQPRIFRYGPHFGEEPPVSGTRGSGAVFFSHCTMRCVYCQNHPWSQAGLGDDLTIPALRTIFKGLAAQGCHNWNLVSPSPWLPQISEAAADLIRAGISLPFVYNTSGFESTRTLDEFSFLADIALVDLRYANPASAAEGSDAERYVAAARETLLWFWNRLGPLDVDDDGIARRGVICRLLALPGRVHEAVANLEWLAKATGNTLHVSVMSQYTPVYRAMEMEGWNRKVREDEYKLLTDAVSDLGFCEGWIQEFEGEAPADLLGQAMPKGQGAVGAG